MKRKIMGCSVLRHDQTCLVGAAGEALEAELNKTGPGSCKFVKSDISKEEDIKVKCSFVGVWSEMERVTWSHDDHMMISLNSESDSCIHCGCVFVICWFLLSLQRLIAVTVEQFGHIDCLVNNAGWRESFVCVLLFFTNKETWQQGCVAYCLFLCLKSSSSDPPHKPTDDTTAEEFRDLLNLNLVSYFLASKVRFHSFGYK